MVVFLTIDPCNRRFCPEPDGGRTRCFQYSTSHRISRRRPLNGYCG